MQGSPFQQSEEGASEQTEPTSRHTSTEHSRLFQLPAELRNRILESLLSSPTPLDSRSHGCHVKGCPARHRHISFDLWPAILRTCRQMHYEGTLVLHGNTFSFLVSTAADRVDLGCHWNILRPRSMPWPLRKMITKVHITLEADFGDWGQHLTAIEDVFRATHRLVRALSKTLKYFSALRILAIQLKADPAPNIELSHDGSEITDWVRFFQPLRAYKHDIRDRNWNAVLEPLRRIRGLSHSEIGGTGVSSTFVEEMGYMMTQERSEYERKIRQ